ncbi:putative quinol monooxygenase [Shivajiella indica]|uniref:Quinol monooxygenase n=1 Tax=Shivajiella indica TaxID=872115 RepID=A0ABW5B7J2_9BACT
MLVRVVKMTFKKDSVNDFLENFNSHKEMIRNFPGCSHLELWQDKNFENIFMTYSYWDSEEALEQYRDSELFKSVWSYTKSLFADKPMAFSAKKIEELP